MARYPSIRLKIEKFITPTQLQQKLLDIIDNDEVRRGVNQIIGDLANEYVPRKTGALRDSMHVGPKTISWGMGLNYGRYQYGGEVYRTNLPIVEGGKLSGFFRFGDKRYPILEGGTVTGWFSLPGVKKEPSGQELGIPGEWRGWTFGYTTQNTKHHWIDEMMQNDKKKMQALITNYLKQEAKKRNT